MWMGVMEKMELIAINNRSMFNNNKVQRAEWLTKKVNTHPFKQQNQEEIKIDLRKHPPFHRIRKKDAREFS